MARTAGLCYRWLLAAAMAAMLWPAALSADGEQPNLMRNPDCDAADGEGRPEGWNRRWNRAGDLEFAVDREAKRTGEGSIRLAVPEGGARYPRMMQSVEVEADTRYLLSAWVRSPDGRANMQVTRSSAWHGAGDYGPAAGISASGDWQRVEKRFTPAEDRSVRVLFTLLNPNREAAELWVDSVSLVAEASLRPPDGPEKRTFPQTALVRDGQAVCAIVYPASIAAYRELAERVQRKIRERTGAAPDILPDTAATDERYPVLLDEYRGQNLILLGRLGINRAIWGVYNRFQCAVDGYYPGGDGYVVRTAANVYANGANSIVLGGSSDAGAARAVGRFLEILAEQPTEGGSLALPWLLDVELGGRCKAVFDADEASQGPIASDVRARQLSRHFYVNAMSYYWSGRETYLQLARGTLAMILERMEGGGRISSHYGMEFFVRAWDMLDDSGLFSDEEIAAVDRAIVETFRSYGSGGERSLRNQLLDSRSADPSLADHPTASWLADKAMADFILHKIPAENVPEDIRSEARSRQSLYVQTYDRFMRERWRGCHSGYAATDVATMTMFRYALEMERYEEFFESGNARRAALYHLARVMNPTGADIGLMFGLTAGVVEWRLFLGIAASYYGDGELRAVMDAMSKRGRVHFAVYVNGVHAYEPGDELPPEEPTSLLGATAVPLQQNHYRRLADRTELPYEETFNLATIRGGFGGDDYLLLAGAHDLAPNTMIRLASRGQVWLGHSPERLYFEQNALNVRRLSRWGGAEVSSAARLDHCLNAPGAAFLSSTLPGYEGADWNRRVVWLEGRFFAVLDRVEAFEPDEYLVMANWRPGGGGLQGNRWVRRAGGDEFVIAPANGAELVHDLDVDPVTYSETAVFRQRVARRLQAGESVEIANLMFVRDAGSDVDYEARRHPSGALMVRAAHEGGRLCLIGPLPPEVGSSDAAMLALFEDKAIVFDGSRLEIRGQTLLNRGGKVSAEVPLGRAADGLRAALQGHWDASSAQVPAEDADARFPLDPAPAVRSWRYEGATQPGFVRGARQLDRNTWALGRVASLAGISARSGPMPRQVHVRADEGAEWVPFEGETHWTGSVRMGNYGRVILEEEGYQTLRGGPVEARFVRLQDGNLEPPQIGGRGPRHPPFLFYDASRPATFDPLKAVPADLRGTGQPDIMVVPDIWSGTRNQNHITHDLVVLDAQGRERWRRSAPWRMFFTPRALDWDGSGRQHVFVGSLDNNMYVYDADGELARVLTVADDPGTPRFPLPNAVGAWQPDAQGRRKIVMNRYGTLSFFDRDGSIEGHARSGGRGGYWFNDLLPYGLDYTGDGVEDTVGMHGYALLIITQASVGTAIGTPPIPRRDRTLSGSPTLAFEIYGGEGTRLFVARENMLGIRQLADGGEWTAVWTPDVPLTAAVALAKQRQILAATRDGLLWRFQLDENFEIAEAKSAPLPASVRRFALLGKESGDAIAATDAGLLRIRPDMSATLLAPGDFRHIATLPGPDGPMAVAVDPQGGVEAYRLP